MQCPRCFKTDVSLVNNSHYVCNNPNCINDDGTRTQFSIITDTKIEFPYNQIFVNRNKSEFYRKPYLVIKNEGNMSI